LPAFNNRVGVLQKPADQAYNYCYQNTEQYHGGDGKVKAEVFLFYADVARQVAYPMQFIVKEIDHQPYYHHSAANKHDILASIGIHKKIILNSLQCFPR
jgi:hypothetical protein